MQLTSIKESIREIIEELKDYVQAKRDLIALKTTEKASPIIAQAIYGSVLAILGVIVVTIALFAIIFALALIFVTQGTEPFETIAALTYGSLCLLAFNLLLFLILLALRKSVTSSIRDRFINQYLDNIDRKESNQTKEQIPTQEATQETSNDSPQEPITPLRESKENSSQ